MDSPRTFQPGSSEFASCIAAMKNASQRVEFREKFARPEEQEPITERETVHEARTLSAEAIRVSREVGQRWGNVTG